MTRSAQRKIAASLWSRNVMVADRVTIFEALRDRTARLDPPLRRVFRYERRQHDIAVEALTHNLGLWSAAD